MIALEWSVMLPVFPTEDDLNQSNVELGQDLLALWIASNAEKKGIDPYDVPIKIQEEIVLNTRLIDGDSAINAALEKAIKRAAQGEYEKAGALVRELFAEGVISIITLDECITGKRRQRSNASKPRTDELQKLIIEIATEKPDITQTALLIELKKYKDVRKVIADITEDEIYFTGKGEDSSKAAPISGLKDRLTRAKKIINSR